MPVSIPIFDEPVYRQEITLDGVSYFIDLVWNDRAEQWDLNIFLTDETEIITGVKLVLDYDLLAYVRYKEDLPPGEFYCIDTTGDEEKITRDNLGDTIKLIYIPEGEVDTI